ncbi:MAG TPA: hypothetical protein VGM88_02155 [Kofleriaceae bacterium]|jgi:hypothetical protein
MRAHSFVLAIGLAACHAQATATVEDPNTVESEPPQPQVERVEGRPGSVWVKGHWYMQHKAWQWQAGRWEAEHAGHHYRDGRWEKREHTWVWIEGGWD